MKQLIYLLVFFSLYTTAQEKYITKTGSINFEASVPSFEEVAAKNDAVTAIINSENGDFASLVLVKGFRFKNALMEEHFNENYAESSEFPKATFKGVLKDYKNASGDYKIEGTLTFHGVTKQLENVTVTLNKSDSSITMSGAFSVLASDFGIKIPKIVKKKLSDEVQVSFNFELQKK